MRSQHLAPNPHIS